MAIRDLLWACPLCGSEEPLQPIRGAEVCQRCCASYTRGPRALIVARPPGGGSSLALSPAEWVDRLPDIGIEERIRRAGGRAEIIHSDAAVLRTEIGTTAVSFRGRYLNLIERFGPRREGLLQLMADRISFHYQDQAGPGVAVAPNAADHAGAIGNGAASGAGAAKPPPTIWHFHAITVVQPSSATLQIGARGLPLASLQVPGGSIRLWEELLCGALRSYYQKEGRGEIVEFQPRIMTR